jgi:UPF0755 protein
VGSPGDERTPEERAAAAAERARRRAERDGGSTDLPPPETFAASEPDAPDFELDEPVWDDEPAVAPRRVSAMAVESRRPPRPGVPPRKPLPPHSRRRRGKAGRRILALLAITALAGAFYFINATFQPFHDEGAGSVKVTVPTGANAGQIGKLLEARGVVDEARFFEINATVTFRRGQLKPGKYTLRQGMSNGDVIEALMEGPKVKVVPTVDVNVPEGLSIREAAPRVDKGPLAGSYLKAARSARARKAARKLGAPRRARTAEGFLFPATYTLIDGAPARNLVDRQLAAFGDNIRKVDFGYAKRKNLTRYDVLIIASMVERETQSDRERPLVASVIYNRLKEGIPLGIDATIRYYENNWTRALRQSELTRDEPYNTRLNRGLPPTPIGNPGLASLKAAAQPARTKYLFYVAKPGTCGHAFSSTNSQFERDVARYNEARDKAGGKSPTTC